MNGPSLLPIRTSGSQAPAPEQSNRFLDAVSPELRASFLARLEVVLLPVGTDLYKPGERPRYVHFMTSGMASLVTSMEDGAIVEVGLVGREGFPESSHLLGPAMGATHCFMQIAGSALRMNFGQFGAEFERDTTVRQLALQQVQFSMLQLSQLAACNRLHDVEERLARWLLMVQDRLGTDSFLLTQEFMGEMLGTRRSSVTLTAGSFQRAGLIEYSRGRVHILDRAELVNTACECYGISKRLLDGLYKT